MAVVTTGSAFVADERRKGAPGGRFAAMTRVLVLCCWPMHLSPSDADKWLREEVGGVLADSAVSQIEVTTLLSASATWGRAWDYLIAIELRDGARAGAVVSTGACADLLVELRQLRMRPNVVVASDDRTVVLAEARS